MVRVTVRRPDGSLYWEVTDDDPDFRPIVLNVGPDGALTLAGVGIFKPIAPPYRVEFTPLGVADRPPLDSGEG